MSARARGPPRPLGARPNPLGPAPTPRPAPTPWGSPAPLGPPQPLGARPHPSARPGPSGPRLWPMRPPSLPWQSDLLASDPRPPPVSTCLRRMCAPLSRPTTAKRGNEPACARRATGHCQARRARASVGGVRAGRRSVCLALICVPPHRIGDYRLRLCPRLTCRASCSMLFAEARESLCELCMVAPAEVRESLCCCPVSCAVCSVGCERNNKLLFLAKVVYFFDKLPLPKIRPDPRVVACDCEVV